jgi:hypothetical protein
MSDTQTDAEAQWEDLTRRQAARQLTPAERAAYNLASDNADDTSVERRFDLFSAAWYRVFASTYQAMLDSMDDATIEDWSF